VARVAQDRAWNAAAYQHAREDVSRLNDQLAALGDSHRDPCRSRPGRIPQPEADEASWVGATEGEPNE
jgi:hypothetical protein